MTVNNKRLAFHERGEGNPIVFLHGNPTSSYVWRNVIPHVAGQGRCIAVDLLGCGDSDKLDNPGPGSYTIVEHRQFVDGLLDQLDLGDAVTLVLHDWGTTLGFDWARRHSDRVAGIAYMEAMVRPWKWDDWNWPNGGREVFEAFRSDAGEKLILEDNVFVELVLPTGVIRDLQQAEMAEYRRPFARPGEDRRPTLTWPREQPFEGEPAEVVEIVEAYSAWLVQSPVPKLFINGEPGLMGYGGPREFCRTWRNQTEVTVPGIHYLQEDSPDLIGGAVSRWLAEVVHGGGPEGERHGVGGAIVGSPSSDSHPGRSDRTTDRGCLNDGY